MGLSKTCSLQFLSNVARILPKKLLILSPVALLSLSVPFLVASSAKAQDTTSVVCYFQDFEGTTWKWGLQDDNGWYKLGGRWVIDAVTKFETSAPRDEIVKSCLNSQRYYNFGGKKLISIAAANSSVGRNYGIFSNGQEVKP